MKSREYTEGYEAGSEDYWDREYNSDKNPYLATTQKHKDWSDGYTDGMSEMYDIDHMCDCDICKGLIDD